jgi:hypothetical protein
VFVAPENFLKAIVQDSSNTDGITTEHRQELQERIYKSFVALEEQVKSQRIKVLFLVCLAAFF